jgi:hypothetical protein
MGQPRYGLAHVAVLELCGGAEQLRTNQTQVQWSTLMWVVTPCTLVDSYQRLRRTCCIRLYKATRSLESWVPVYQTTRRHISQDHYLQSPPWERKAFISCVAYSLYWINEIPFCAYFTSRNMLHALPPFFLDHLNSIYWRAGLHIISPLVLPWLGPNHIVNPPYGERPSCTPIHIGRND